MASISEAAARAVRVAPDATVIDVVRAVLAVADRPLPAKAIYQLVAAHHRDSSPSDVHRTLYRLKEAGEVDVTGERPNRLYVLREVQTVLAMTK
jgi:Fe2+ or Zn2+ uptake regulation protein